MTELAELTLLEQRIGRRLTAAEQHIQVETIDRLLNHAKELLEQAILAEQARLARAIADGQSGRLEVTARMRAILADLRAHGQAHAQLELQSMGYPLRSVRRFATEDELAGQLRARLGQLTVKVQAGSVGLDLGALSQNAIEDALVKILGARSIAADLVSPTFVSGLSDTFEQHQDLVAAWQYTAVNDSGLCSECAPHDGEIFDSLEALFEVLPNFGPNPDCLGGDRCRCRAVPVPPDGDLARTVPPSDNIDWTASRAPTIQQSRDALGLLEQVHDIPVDTPAVKIALSDELSAANPGRYTPAAIGGPKIELARDAADPGFTVLHEYGHYLSDLALGDPGSPASFDHPVLDEWRQAIVESEAVRRFVAIGNGDVTVIADLNGEPVVVPVDPDWVFGYYLHPEELFARSYSQWAVMRSGDPVLMRELALARRSPYPEQWQDDDFAGIAAAFDRLTERLGWRTGRT